MTPHPTRHDSPPAENIGKMFDAYAQDWDEFYQSDADGRSFDYTNRRAAALRLVDRLLPPPAQLLEVGSGAGHTAVELARRGYGMVCVDISEGMASATRRTLAGAGQSAQVLLGTVHDLPATLGPFDGVIAMGVMDYVPQPERTIARVVELLKPGGVCLLSFTSSTTPLRWIEQPLKRLAALGLYALTRRARYRDVLFPASRAHSPRQVRAWYQQAGLQCDSFQYFSFGLRFGSFWIPPLRWVRRWETALAQSPVRSAARGFIAVGRKPAQGAMRSTADQPGSREA